MIESIGGRFKDIFRKDLSAMEKALEIASELPESKENWRIKKKGICIVGDSGGGKTTLAIIQGAIYGISETRNFKIGEIMRRLAGAESVAGYFERDPLIDKLVDDLQTELVRGALENDPFILEGRRAGLVLRTERATAPKLGQAVKSVLLTVPPEIAKERLHHRMPSYSLEEVETLTLDRAQKDRERWNEVHPEEAEKDPYDPHIFDFVADATKPIRDVFCDVHNWLVDINFIEKDQKPQTIEPSALFEA